MDFSLDDDHLALRDAVQRWCEAEHPAQTRGVLPTPERAAGLRAGLAGLGLLGLHVGPEHGGLGLGPVEALLAAQELGRVLDAGAFVPSALMSAALMAEAGSPAQQQRWLPALVEGRLPVALACQEPGARYALTQVRCRARAADGGWRLDGRKDLVLGGDDAGLLLVVARTAGADHDTSGLTLFALDAGTPGLARQAHDTIDGRRAATLVLDGVQAADDRIVGPLGGALPLVQRAVDRAEAALCAEAAGALDALIQITAEHLRTRRQFGSPLAKFQALQHRVADMAIALEQVKSMACAAALALQADSDAERRRLLSAAKALTAQLSRRCALDAIQLHGAMGMTDECVASRYARRLIGIGQWFGDAALHLQRFAAAAPAP
jgi:alkylation response protein AidB-like acyl-CoA dehydrogenase